MHPLVVSLRRLDPTAPCLSCLITAQVRSYRDVFLNEWLSQQGFLARNRSAAHGLRARMGRLGITRSNVSRILRAIGLGRVEHADQDPRGDAISVLPRDSWGDLAEVIDWQKTRAYSYGYYGQIYLNVRGREPSGVVSPGAEYEGVRDEIISALHAWRSPTDGEPVVSAVYTREDLFAGPFADRAPDLTVVMRNLAYVTRYGYEFSRARGEVFTAPLTGESGSHRLDGLLVAGGEGLISNKGSAPAASLMDITPTALHLLGLPIPSHVDGSVLTTYLAAEWRAREVRHYDDEGWVQEEHAKAVLGRDEEEEVVDRLRHLGYL